MKQLDQIGFGTYKLYGEECYQSVKNALQLGYRTIDTALLYKNHKEISRAIKDSGIQRSEIFIISKIHFKQINSGQIDLGIELILKELDTPYIDLLLLHAPSKEIQLDLANWSKMILIRNKFLARFIGVSNFGIKELQNLILNSTEIPFINQIELSPFLQRKDLVDFCKENKILIQAYRSLMGGLKLTKLTKLTSSDLLFGWSITKSFYILPSSKNFLHIKQNLLIKALSDELMEELDKFDENFFTMERYKN